MASHGGVAVHSVTPGIRQRGANTTIANAADVLDRGRGGVKRGPSSNWQDNRLTGRKIQVRILTGTTPILL